MHPALMTIPPPLRIERIELISSYSMTIKCGNDTKGGRVNRMLPADLWGLCLHFSNELYYLGYQ